MIIRKELIVRDLLPIESAQKFLRKFRDLSKSEQDRIVSRSGTVTDVRELTEELRKISSLQTTSDLQLLALLTEKRISYDTDIVSKRSLILPLPYSKESEILLVDMFYPKDTEKPFWLWFNDPVEEQGLKLLILPFDGAIEQALVQAQLASRSERTPVYCVTNLFKNRVKPDIKEIHTYQKKLANRFLYDYGKADKTKPGFDGLKRLSFINAAIYLNSLLTDPSYSKDLTPFYQSALSRSLFTKPPTKLQRLKTKLRN